MQQLHISPLTCPSTNADVGLSGKEKVKLKSLKEEPSTPDLLGHHVQRWHQRRCQEAPSGFLPLRTPGLIQPLVTKRGGGGEAQASRRRVSHGFLWRAGEPPSIPKHFPFFFGSHLLPFSRSRCSPTIQGEEVLWKGGQVRNGSFAVGSHLEPASDKPPEGWGSCVLTGKKGLVLNLSAPSQLGPIQLRGFLRGQILLLLIPWLIFQAGIDISA